MLHYWLIDACISWNTYVPYVCTYDYGRVHRFLKNLGVTSEFYMWEGDMKQFPYWGPTNIMCHCSKFSHLGVCHHIYASAADPSYIMNYEGWSESKFMVHILGVLKVALQLLWSSIHLMLHSRGTEPHRPYLQHTVNVDNPSRCNGMNGSWLLMSPIPFLQRSYSHMKQCSRQVEE